MKGSKQSRRLAKQLFKSCQVDGRLNADRVRKAVGLLFVSKTAATEIYTHSLHDALPILIEIANFRAEYVHNRITTIQKHPVARLFTFDAANDASIFFDHFEKQICKRGHLARRSTRCDNHVICHLGLALQRDRHDVFGFVFIK